ncbi:MAG TPA: hypothetical protein VFA49_06830 [Chloroflexota bacterium]|jgi:hypothetical protein|nr:hypothetical protein [Chloroflexota bacterium]
MARWVAVGLGCVTALGMQGAFDALLRQFGAAESPLAARGAQFVALVLAGYVAGHLVGRWHALHGALAAVAYIFVTVTMTSIREIAIARQLGLAALAPIDFGQLALNDVVAMTGASCGGWLASRLDTRPG